MSKEIYLYHLMNEIEEFYRFEVAKAKYLMLQKVRELKNENSANSENKVPDFAISQFLDQSYPKRKQNVPKMINKHKDLIKEISIFAMDSSGKVVVPESMWQPLI